MLYSFYNSIVLIFHLLLFLIDLLDHLYIVLLLLTVFLRILLFFNLHLISFRLLESFLVVDTTHIIIFLITTALTTAMTTAVVLITRNIFVCDYIWSSLRIFFTLEDNLSCLLSFFLGTRLFIITHLVLSGDFAVDCST